MRILLARSTLTALAALACACVAGPDDGEPIDPVELGAADEAAATDELPGPEPIVVDDDGAPPAPTEPPVPAEPEPIEAPEDLPELPDDEHAPSSLVAGPSWFTRPAGYITVRSNFPGHYYFAPEASFSILLNVCPAAPWRVGWWGNNTAWGHRYWFRAWCGENFELFAPRLGDPQRGPAQTQVWRENNLQANELPAWTQIYIEECAADPSRRGPWWFNSGHGHDYWFDVWCGNWVATFRRPADATAIAPIAGGRKQIMAFNIPVRAASGVPDAALRQARGVMLSMFGTNTAAPNALGGRGVTGAIMGRYQLQTQLPEYASLTPAAMWDCRARGLGAAPGGIQTFSGAEENLLQYGPPPPGTPGQPSCVPYGYGFHNGTGFDPYRGREDIFLHEFGHATLSYAPFSVAGISSTLRTRVQQRYNQWCPCGNKTCCAGPWAGTYAVDTLDEYWAEGVQSYFNANDEGSGGSHGALNTRAELYAWDRPLFDLIAEVYPAQAWYPDDATCYAGFCNWCRAPFCYL